MMTMAMMKRRSYAQKGLAMNNLSAECIEQNDAKAKVLHVIRGDIDGEKYKIQFSAPCPMTAIKIARCVPIAYWEKE
jgi:hypothetical protein